MCLMVLGGGLGELGSTFEAGNGYNGWLYSNIQIGIFFIMIK